MAVTAADDSSDDTVPESLAELEERWCVRALLPPTTMPNRVVCPFALLECPPSNWRGNHPAVPANNLETRNTMSKKFDSSQRTVALRSCAIAAIFAMTLTGVLVAQPPNPASPRTSAATQIGDHWIKIDYSAPILRGRQGIFGEGDSYGQTVKAGAPVWRAGADSNTRIKTDVDLEIGGTKVPAGEYSLLIDIKEGEWTAIVSSQPSIGRVTSREDVQKGMAEGKSWGAYGYKPENDVARAEMMVNKSEQSTDNLVYWFSGVSDEGGSIGIAWDDHIAMLPFKVAK